MTTLYATAVCDGGGCAWNGNNDDLPWVSSWGEMLLGFYEIILKFV